MKASSYVHQGNLRRSTDRQLAASWQELESWADTSIPTYACTDVWGGAWPCMPSHGMSSASVCPFACWLVRLGLWVLVEDVVLSVCSCAQMCMCVCVFLCEGLVTTLIIRKRASCCMYLCVRRRKDVNHRSRYSLARSTHVVCEH